jgi:hypothetical protein
MELIRINPNKEWDEFVSQYTDLIFYQKIWADILAKAYPKNRLIYLVLKDKGNWLMGMPAMLLNFKFFNIFHSLIYYGGFIGERKYIPIFLELLERKAKEYRFQRIQIFDPQIKNEEELLIYGFKSKGFYRNILNLKEFKEDITKNYSSSLRRNIKKAESENLLFERIKEEEEIEIFYRLYLESMKRNRALAKYPKSFLYAIYDLINLELADIFFIKYEDRLIAGILVVYSKDTTHYLQGGSATDYLYLRANDLLFHKAIIFSQQKKKDYFDFLSSDKRLTSLIRYKDKFGSHREELFDFYKDIGYFRPFIWNFAYKIANIPIISTIINKIKSG